MGLRSLFDEYRSPLHVACGRALILALIPGIIGMASEYWLEAPSDAGVPVSGGSGGSGVDGGSRSIWHLGLWAVCSNFSRCASLPSHEFPDAFNPVRGLGVTSLLLHVLSVLVGLACSCEDPENLVGFNAWVPRLEETLTLTAGILMGGALGIFAHITQQHHVYHTFHLAWSFWLLLFYFCFLLLAGGVVALLRHQCACLSPCQQTTHRFRIQRHSSQQRTEFDQHVIEKRYVVHHLEEKNMSFFVESSKEDGLRYENLSTKTWLSHFWGRFKGSGRVYSSLEGLPRMLQKLSGETEKTDFV